VTAAIWPTPGCVEADLVRLFAAADIATEDWDLLFRAALELLSRVALDEAVPDGQELQLQAPLAALPAEEGLERCTCECHAVVRAEYARLLPHCAAT
jgi:hypothetical protein